MKAKIAPALLDLMVPIEELEPHPRNRYREHDLGAIGVSYEEFSQLSPIVAQRRPDGPHWVVAGRGQLLAARQLGWTHIAVAVHDLDDATAERFILADNRVHELGSTNQDELAGLLRDLAERDLLGGTGYDGDDVDALLAKVEADSMPIDPEAPPAGSDDPGIDVESQFAVAVLCSSEAHQREVFERLGAEGYAVKVLAV